MNDEFMTDRNSGLGDAAELRRRVVAAIDAARPRLGALAQQLHSDPELAFAEVRSAGRVAAVLEDAGYRVERGAGGLPTALRAWLPDAAGDFEVAVCAEYDALPGLGHACGHNVIAAAAVGAAIGLAAVAREAAMRPVVLGTPAEEHGAGKVAMLRAGAWDRAAISLMVHPAPVDSWPTAVVMQAVHRLRVEFTGRAAHAAAAPDQALNAGDAATLALVAIGLLRQQVRDGARIGAIVSEAGEVTNIIPGRSVVELEVREADAAALAALRERVLACFAGAALATGCQWRWEESEPLYAELRQDEWLVDRFAAHLIERGRPVRADEPRRSGGSTDMGNVSHVVPSIHPPIGIRGAAGPIHTAEFAAAAATPAAVDAAVDGAVALALTALDAALDPTARTRYLSGLAARTANVGRENAPDVIHSPE